MKKNGCLAQAVALVMLLVTGMVVPVSAVAADSICATVKIQIVQELTLERQAFDANMKITNGLTHISLEDVQIDVTFADEEGNSVLASSDSTNTDALFFIRIDSMDGIDDVEGDGVVEPESTADIHWLIIPAQGASNGLESGTLYYVGATLTYTINGTEHVTEVSPDYIYVKPLPDLTLDYFLPHDVYGDDPFTDEIEEEIPFPLGVRVSNNGEGTAYSLKIESAQPKIVENELGLLIDFTITGSEVNGQEVTSSLLVDFGDIAPNDAGTARWTMICSLYGQFVEFTAEFTHSDELGGEMTSLISDVNTHFLVHDVLVDLPGRDAIKDFLSLDGIAYTVYESDNVDTAVTNQSASATLVKTGTSGTQSTYTLTVPATTGPMVVKLDDPFSDSKVILSATRSDGKSIPEYNVWLYKTREKNNPWDCYFYLFDVNTPGTYTIVFEDPTVLPQAPVLQYIPDRQRVEEQQLSFIVEASDPNGTIPSFSTSSLPVGATFVDNGDGTGLFDWTPMSGQAGTYTIKFTASDGALSASRTAIQTICSLEDSDCDGMNDEWELEHFGTLDRDGTGDYDGDGISDLDEYLNGTDPNGTENAPTVPVIYAPQTCDTVTELQPQLIVECSTDADGDTLTYEFELFSDAGYTTLTASATEVEEFGVIVPWIVPEELVENQIYYWRARAFDGTAYSLWVHGRFLVSQENDAPGDFELLTPGNTDTVDTLTPILVSGFSTDPENDDLTYTFAVYADEGLTELIATGQGTQDEESGMVFRQVSQTLTDQLTYYWQVTAEDTDENTVASEVFSFTVQTENQTPPTPAIDSPESGSEVTTTTVMLSIGAVSDADADQVGYDFQVDVTRDFSSANLMSAADDEITATGDTIQWQIENLSDNTLYYWRARSRDSVSASQWVYGQFFVNTYNDAPGTPVIQNPGDLAWVDTLTPSLSVHQTEEPDNDTVELVVELYEDEDLEDLVIEASSDTLSVTISQELENATWYYWRAKLVDSHDIEGEWSVVQSFFVKEDATDDPPTITLTTPATDTTITVDDSGKVFTLSWGDEDPDSDARISLYYDTDDSGEDGTLIISGISENSDEANDSYEWNVSGIVGGTYYLYALISDGTTTVADYAPGSIHINYPPLDPSSPEPADGETNLSVIDLSLSWASGDPDEEDTVTYDVQYKAQGGEFILACDDIFDTECQLSTLLNYSTTYLWQVLATDSFGATTLGQEWQFTTFAADEDADNDGLNNENEITVGTDPFDEDTDKDSYTDGEEFYAGTDPSNAASIPPYPPKYGDLDGDLDIDGADLSLLMSMLNLTSADAGFDSDADFNSDGVIDALDLELFVKIFGYLFTGP